jgi:hypothetical protein
MSNKTYTAGDIMESMKKGMSDFQIKNFVVNAQLTPIKQLHQAAMEAEVREENIRQGDFEIKKNELKVRIINAKQVKETDELALAELELELLVCNKKIAATKKEQIRMQHELKSFYDVIDFFNQNYDIDAMLEMQDTLEIDYWVKRLAKQAALDLISSGRINNGNLSAMLDMPDEIFQICLKETYALTSQLAKSVPFPALGGGSQEEFLLKFGPAPINKVENNVIDKI